MKRTILASALSLGAVTAPAAAAEIQIASTGPVIELTVSDTVQAKPDAATISAGVTTRAQTANEAARLNAERMDRIVARLKQIGIAEDDIQTSNFSLSPQYSYRNDGQQPTFQGYDASNQVMVKLRDIRRVGPTLDALVAAGANNFSGPNFILENDGPPKTQARRNAFASAEARARELAALAGYNSVKLLELSETYQTVSQPYAQGEAIAVSAQRVDKATPIQPGVVGTSAQLTVKYEMTRQGT